ncbi:MAG: hypothetical protein ACK5Q6_04650 [Cyanobacteriota bacterium]
MPHRENQANASNRLTSSYTINTFLRILGNKMQHEMAGRRAIDTILMKTEKSYESSLCKPILSLSSAQVQTKRAPD